MTALNRSLVRYVRRGNKTSASGAGNRGGTGPDRNRSNRSTVMSYDLSNEPANEQTSSVREYRRIVETIRRDRAMHSGGLRA